MLLLLLAVAITANLLGLFELPVLGGGLQPAGSFGTGALAAFVATPCAGPFLGAALGTALRFRAPVRSRYLPRLGLVSGCRSCCSPSSRRFGTGCRSPAAWMDRLKRFLAIPMAASAAAALWLLLGWLASGRLLIGLVATAALASASVVAGRMPGAARSAPGARCRAALCIIGFVAVAECTASATSHLVQGVGAVERSTRAASYVQQGKPVFVYFTADWCLSCKVNEAAAIDRAEVRDAFKQAGVEVLAATGPTAIRRSRASSRAADGPGCRFTCGTRRESRRRSCRSCSPRRCSLTALAR